MKKDLDYYMGLPYSRVIEEKNDESGHYFYGYIKELPGCQSTSEAREEIFSSLDEAMEGWLEVKLENNVPIPEPDKESERVAEVKSLFTKMPRKDKMRTLYHLAGYLVENPTSLHNSKIRDIYMHAADLVNAMDCLSSEVLKEYTYVAVFTPEVGGMFSVNFPDLEGCYTCGDDKEDAIKSAKDVLAMSILGYIEDGKVLPMPAKASDIECTDAESRMKITVNLREFVESA